MGKIWVLVVLAGCSAYPKVDWPAGGAGQAPAFLALDDLQGTEPGAADGAGAALAARAADLQARVAESR